MKFLLILLILFTTRLTIFLHMNNSGYTGGDDSIFYLYNAKLFSCKFLEYFFQDYTGKCETISFDTEMYEGTTKQEVINNILNPNFWIVAFFSIFETLFGLLNGKIVFIFIQELLYTKCILNANMNKRSILFCILNPFEWYFCTCFLKETAIIFIILISLSKGTNSIKFTYISIISLFRPINGIMLLFYNNTIRYLATRYLYTSLTIFVAALAISLYTKDDFINFSSLPDASIYASFNKFDYVSKILLTIYGLIFPIPYFTFEFQDIYYSLFVFFGGIYYYCFWTFNVLRCRFSYNLVVFTLVNIAFSALLDGSQTKIRFIAPFFIVFIVNHFYRPRSAQFKSC